MLESTDRYTATRLSAELGLDNRKMRDILTRVNPVQVKGRSKLCLLRDVIPHAAKYLGAPDVIDLNAERARKVKAEAELAEIELAKARNADGSLDAPGNKIVENAWKAWGQRGNSTVDGRLSWVDAQRLFIETLARDSKVLVRFIYVYSNL